MNDLKTSLAAAAVVGALVLPSACGTATGNEATPSTTSADAESTATALDVLTPERLDAKAKAAVTGVGIYDTEFDATYPVPNWIMDLHDVLALARVVEFREGPAYEVFPDDPDKEPTTVMVAEPITVFKGNVEVGERIHVIMHVSDTHDLSSAIPAGALTFVAAELWPSGEDKYHDDPWRGIPEGAQRYQLSAILGAFADGDQHTWRPMMQATDPHPLTGLLPASMKKELPASLR